MLKPTGYTLVKHQGMVRSSMEGVLAHIKTVFTPRLIIDVGAATGSFTRLSLQHFPEASAVLFEPVSAYTPALAALTRTHPRVTYIPKAASDHTGVLPFYIHEDLVGSSSKQEAEGAAVDGTRTSVPCITLDEALALTDCTASLIKIDVQGAELEVLRGATRVLEQAACVILEVSLFRSLIGGGDVAEVIAFMKERYWVLYDIAGMLYRPYDGALSQYDAVFVKDTSNFRAFHGFASPAQRAAQNERFKHEQNTLLAHS